MKLDKNKRAQVLVQILGMLNLRQQVAIYAGSSWKFEKLDAVGGHLGLGRSQSKKEWLNNLCFCFAKTFGSVITESMWMPPAAMHLNGVTVQCLQTNTWIQGTLTVWPLIGLSPSDSNL